MNYGRDFKKLKKEFCDYQLQFDLPMANQMKCNLMNQWLMPINLVPWRPDIRKYLCK
jgi:hypothetical protein